MSGFGASGVRALLLREPWRRDYELVLGVTAGRRTLAAVGVKPDGSVEYREHDDAAAMPTLLRLSQDELDAIARVVLEESRPEDATVDALRDARVVRDRLLTMIERQAPDTAENP